MSYGLALAEVALVAAYLVLCLSLGAGLALGTLWLGGRKQPTPQAGSARSRTATLKQRKEHVK